MAEASPWCFDEAAAYVLRLMERDSWPRFLRSSTCGRLRARGLDSPHLTSPQWMAGTFTHTAAIQHSLQSFQTAVSSSPHEEGSWWQTQAGDLRIWWDGTKSKAAICSAQARALSQISTIDGTAMTFRSVMTGGHHYDTTCLIYRKWMWEH